MRSLVTHPLVRPRTGPRRAAAHVWRAPVLLLALLLPPLLAIILVARGAMPPGGAPLRAAPPRALQGVPVIDPCCVRWQRTALTAESDALLTDPWQPGVVFAGTTKGIRRTADGGRTWQHEAGVPSTATIISLAGTKTAGALFAGDGAGVVYTRPRNGDRWRAISPPLDGGNPLFGLAVAPDGQTVLAGTVGVLYRGVAQGSQWRWQAVAHTGQSSVPSIVFAPGDPRRAYATVFGSAPAVLRSDDDGRTWHADTRGLPATLPSVALLAGAPAAGQVVLTTMGNGVWARGTDGRWRDISANLPEHHAMPIAVDARGTLYAGTMGYGVYMREPNGSWQRLGHELSGGEYTSLGLAIAGGPHPTLLVGTAEGVYRLTAT